MLEADNRYPCHYMPQGLSPSDLETRLQFCIVPIRTNARRHFLFKNMYYDKAMLTKGDFSDFHNNTGLSSLIVSSSHSSLNSYSIQKNNPSTSVSM